MADPATILIVDDSRIFRAVLEATLRGQDGLAVAGSVFSGQKALEFIRRHPPDLVTLDVEMPGMDGLQTLEAIQQINRSLAPGAEIGVVMVSAFTKRGADVTVQALEAGAFDFVTKPSGGSSEESLVILRQDLLPKVRMFLARRGRVAGATKTAPIPRPEPPIATRPAAAPRTLKAVLIAASTGGPKALATLLPDLAGRVDAPILVVQHMPAEFTRSLAQSLARQARREVVEAEDGQPLRPRTVYIARGGNHLLVRVDPAGRLVTALNEQPPESGCRPSADVLFRSAAILGRETVAIVLTGMGSDGTAGLVPLKRAGAYVIAQDEESSVVWGMPGNAVAAGLTDAVLSLGDIAAAVESLSIQRNAS